MKDFCRLRSDMPDGFAFEGKYYAVLRVFENLIVNSCDAIKHLPFEDRLIQLSCAYQTIEGREVVYFEFEDNGAGIPPEILEKIFERNFSTKPKPENADLLASGHGQGLYACRMNIERIHGGKIWVESVPGKKTTFKFWIPLNIKLKAPVNDGAPPH